MIGSNNANTNGLIFIVISGILGYAWPTVGQIVPDRSLGNESSIVTPNISEENIVINLIEGGAVRGNSLLHSFQEFNVNEGQQVYFDNPNQIENIIGRVTGGNVSEIFGQLGVLGNANLLLLNPQGFVFGQNASLDIRGAFTASASQSVLLGNNFEFSATNPQAAPLLTINQTPGLTDWLNPTGSIANHGNLSTGEDLTLIGSNLDLAGQLNAGTDLNLQASDRITIRDRPTDPSIVAARSQLFIQAPQKLEITALNHPDSHLFSGSNLILRSASPIVTDARFFSGGNFRLEQINGNLGTANSSENTVIQARGNVSFDSYRGGSLQILAGGSVRINHIEITATEPGNAISENVTLSDGITVVSINANMQPTVDIRAGTTNFQAPGIMNGKGQVGGTVSEAETLGIAAIYVDSIVNPGGLVFLTNQERSPAKLFSPITVGKINSVGLVNGGSIFIDSQGEINVNQSIDVSGTSGNGGDVYLLANGNIFLSGSAQILSYGFGGVGGNITVNSNSGINAAYLETITFGDGTGGDIRAIAPQITLGSNLAASPTEQIGRIAAELLGNGIGGNVVIEADRLEIKDGAGISVNNQGNGTGGRVEIRANELSLADRAFISAQTATNGGDINLFAADLLLLREGSQIFTIAGNSMAGGNGGNMNISTNVLATIPNEINDIAANAIDGRGGNVEITAEGIFGFDFPAQPTPFSDITASSAVTVSGTMVANSPAVDPSSGLVKLSDRFRDDRDRIFVGCAVVGGNSLTVTGRGGLPENPTAPLRGQTLLSDLRDFVTIEDPNQFDRYFDNLRSSSSKIPMIVEANGWTIDDRGNIELVARSHPEISAPNLTDCDDIYR